MVQTMAARSEMTSAPRRASDDQASFLSRWLKVWVILLTVVILVVVVFLVIITETLASINGNLATADSSVAGAGGDVSTLDAQVDRINASLGSIDPALKPIPGQVDDIVAALTSIDAKLTDTDASLKDTSSILVTVLGQVRSVDGILVDANDPGDRLGVQNIHRRVASINGLNSPAVGGGAAGGGGCGEFCQPNTLNTAEQDARDILAGLVQVNSHLKGICTAAAVVVLTGPGC